MSSKLASHETWHNAKTWPSKHDMLKHGKQKFELEKNALQILQPWNKCGNLRRRNMAHQNPSQGKKMALWILGCCNLVLKNA